LVFATNSRRRTWGKQLKDREWIYLRRGTCHFQATGLSRRAKMSAKKNMSEKKFVRFREKSLNIPRPCEDQTTRGHWTCGSMYGAKNSGPQRKDYPSCWKKGIHRREKVIDYFSLFYQKRNDGRILLPVMGKREKPSEITKGGNKRQARERG